MTSLAIEVDRVLNRLDPVTSELFERAVRALIALAEQRTWSASGMGLGECAEPHKKQGD